MPTVECRWEFSDVGEECRLGGHVVIDTQADEKISLNNILRGGIEVLRLGVRGRRLRPVVLDRWAKCFKPTCP
jgi:hypothetical protein